MKRFMLVALLGLAAMGTEREADAGATASGIFCNAVPGSFGWCEGTLEEFRADPDPNAFAAFDTVIDPNIGAYAGSFSALLKERYYQCSASKLLLPYWKEIYAGNHFYVAWDGKGECVYLIVLRSSKHLP
jgi:hypothetical protein